MSIRLGVHLSRTLRPIQIGIVLGLPIFVGIVMAVFAASSMANADRTFVQSLAPHLAVLLETNEEIEAQRLVMSVSAHSEKMIQVWWDGEIVASSFDVKDLGISASKPVEGAFHIANGKLWSVGQIKRDNGASLNAFLVVASPLSSLIKTTGLAFVVVFAFAVAVSLLIGRRISSSTNHAVVEPIEILTDAISRLATDDSTAMPETKITELGAIRSTISETRTKLKQATDELAESKAKELSGRLYRELIHDLHTPVTALREMTKISVDGRYSEEARERARAQLPELAEQVLNQVGAGRDNLNHTIRLQRDADLVESLAKTAERARLAVSTNHKCEVIALLPDERFRIPHDPQMLERAVANLILNAAEAKSSKVEVRLESKDGRPRIRISDNGPGMDQDVVSLYFVGRGKSSKGDRTALGLSGCNHIVKAHGARLVHRKSLLGGSEFEIRF